MSNRDLDDASAAPLGELIGDDTVRFTRIFRAPQWRVWDALLTPESLRAWLGEATVDARAGGAFVIRWDETHAMEGRIVELDEPRRLLIAWHETRDGEPALNATTAEDESSLSFELEALDEATTQLVLVHRLIRREKMAGIGGGWHSHLAALAAALAGNTLDIEAAYAAVLPRYEALLAAPAQP
jgi:uncharacterized protein YndB with AHSA1/START domain